MERKSSLSMEAMKFYGYHDQTISPYKTHINGSKRIINNPFISAPHHFDNFMIHNMGILQTPPPPLLTRSYPPYTFQQPPLPPLLPLPTANPHQAANCLSVTRSLPANNKLNNTNNRPKKSKSFPKNTKKDEKNLPKRVTVSSTTTSLESNAKKLQKDVKKALPRVSIVTTNSGVSTNISGALKVEEDHVGIFSSSGVFSISPPPSSLPLPTFSLRPKHSCSAEAVTAFDSRATDNLRRILQLR